MDRDEAHPARTEQLRRLYEPIIEQTFSPRLGSTPFKLSAVPVVYRPGVG
jgi:hypothetical protein